MNNRRLRPATVAAAMIATCFLPQSALAATCGLWAPGVLTQPKAGDESKAIRVNWTTAPPGGCTNTTGDNWDGTDHLELHRLAGTSPPSAASPSTRVASFANGTTQRDDFVQRSNKTYAHRLFACENAACTSWYADTSGSDESTNSHSDTETTETEVWVLEGISGPSDTGDMILKATAWNDPQPNAPHAFFYPSGWSGALGGRLALYWSWQDSGVSQVWYMLHDAAGWPGGGFNVSANWDAAVLVAEGSTDDADDDYMADHPWAMLTRDGSDNRVQLFVQSQNPADGFNQAIQIESADEVGDDFGLTCGTSCADTILDAGGYLAIEADGTSATDYLEDARHSRVAWDYVADGYIDAGSDEPFMMFQMERPDSGTCSAPLPDDIGRADGSWDSGSSSWIWDLDLEAASPYCPEIHVADGHDNATIPLPAGQFKMYYKDSDDHTWYVTYWNGGWWEDTTPIEIYFDDGPTSPLVQKCVENVSALVYVDGGGFPHEGMFAQVLDADMACSDGDPSGGMDDDGADDEDDAGIVFLTLWN